MTRAKTLEAMLAALTVGGRLNPERSRALERWKYGDPAGHVRFEREKKGGAVQRDIDEVQMLLDEWADWMRKPEPMVDGYPEEAPGFLAGSLKDNEELLAVADAERMDRINTAVYDLAPVYRDAIMRHYKLGSQVWRFAQAASLEDAKIMVRVKFVKKGLL